MSNISEEVKYAIREAEMLCMGVDEARTASRVINYASRLSGQSPNLVKNAYNVLKLTDINKQYNQ